MTESSVEFGAKDLGGPKNTPPGNSTTPSVELTNELISRQRLSRNIAGITIAVLSIAAIACLGFAMYVGCHFLGVLEKDSTIDKARQGSEVAAKMLTKDDSYHKGAPTKLDENQKAEIIAPQSFPVANESLYIKILAPLIPASFSSALAIILFITIARFATNYERAGRENSEKEKIEDYGAISALVQEVGKLVQTLRGK
ncbi:hypothetical protein ACSEUP_06165 [Pseudomonas aeruginosa]|uniref:hypothetical protein n=1 Tax=Pseudomonas aeruginosa TaxID=287 RepID=UPI001A29BD5A|nr:hypothetical protein [Pseudomonas aeruginosa]MBH8768756.1 hypothetical protein [Pseudomonas aeruginosa]MBH9126089.1 hypothetical protein [Pseudomonas aeruginosa]MBH9162219.1 hypothetical protein [Pseudomonas aeruginosa]MBI8743320.1 hypothetical protein [Pseudomonas aeruginosa]HBP1311364.1 hypothetical protein [Pseudomonas aeruginosa]